MGNDCLWVWQVTTRTIMHWQETANEIELAQTRYEVATIDRGYDVYAAVWEASIGQILPCEQERGNIHDPYTVAVAKNNHTPIDSDALVLNENFLG